MENSLLFFYKNAQKKTAGIIFFSGLLFLLTTLLLQYREKSILLNQQALSIEKSIRNDLLTGNKVHVYESCRSHFSDKSIKRLTITRDLDFYCNLDRTESSLFVVSTRVPILFNPTEPATSENEVGFVSMRIDAEIIFINLLINLVFLIVIVLVFYFADKRLHNIIRQEIVLPIGDFSKVMASNLRDATPLKEITSQTRFSEMHVLSDSYLDLVSKLEEAEKNLIEESKRSVLVNISRQVAHDIRSPLSVLNILSKKIQPILQEEGLLLSEASNRIMKIADDLLDQSRFNSSITPPPSEIKLDNPSVSLASCETIQQTCLSLIAEKMLTAPSNIRIQYYAEDTSQKNYRCEIGTLSRLLSNLINNSIEAINDSGFVILNFSEVSDKLILELRDSGKGIPQEILEQVQLKSVSHGKERGNGLGLFPAIQAVRSWGGDVKIESAPNRGTKISISLIS